MADITLVIDTPSGDKTMNATAGKVTRLIVPDGTRWLWLTLEAAGYFEVDHTQAKLDGDDSNTAKRQKLAAGTYKIRNPYSGRGAQTQVGSKYLYLVGSANTQPYWVTASSNADG